MKVILQQDIRGTGKKGQLIEVSDGYARNYLFPRKLAAPADNANMNEYRQKEASKAFHKQQELEAAQALAQKLEGITVKVTAKGGSAGRLFGSVTAKEVAELASAQTGSPIDKKKLVMEDIKTFGTYEVEARIYPGVSAKFFVAVIEG